MIRSHYFSSKEGVGTHTQGVISTLYSSVNLEEEELMMLVKSLHCILDSTCWLRGRAGVTNQHNFTDVK